MKTWILNCIIIFGFFAASYLIPVEIIWQGILLLVLPYVSIVQGIGYWHNTTKKPFKHCLWLSTNISIFFILLTLGAFVVGRSSTYLYQPIILALGHGCLVLAMILLKPVWHAWNSWCQQSLVLSLTQSHLLVVGVITLPIILLLVIQRGQSTIVQDVIPPDLPLISQFMILIITGILPTALILLGFSLLGITLVFPLAFLIAYLTAHKMTSRVRQLAQKMDFFSQGLHHVRWEVVGDDEIAHLGEHFNTMAHAIEHLIHELQRQHNRVQDTAQAQQILFANISHELRTPIMILTTHIEQLSEIEAPTDLQWQLLEQQIKQLHRLLNDIFLLARHSPQALGVSLQAQDIHLIIEQSIETWRQLAWDRYRIVLTTDFLKGTACAWVDATRLEQIISNLIHNALHHTPPGGIITLTTQLIYSNKISYISVGVCDTGQGIAQEDLAYLWDPFFHGRDGKTGLGLTVVKTLTETMSGIVHAENLSEGGACFTISIRACDITVT